MWKCITSYSSYLLEQVLYVSTQNQVKIGPCIHITLKKCEQYVYSSITNHMWLQTMLIFPFHTLKQGLGWSPLDESTYTNTKA